MKNFPPVEQANEDGLLAIGGNLDLQTLVEAYTHGIFPWPINDQFPVTWFAPDPRGVVFTNKIHISKSLKRFLNNCQYEIKFNTSFEEVIKACADTKNRPQKGTWITNEIIEAYKILFEQRLAYCAATFYRGKLVGGMYGVCIGNFISGESMFYSRENASKFALIHLAKKLLEKNITWFDTQQTTTVVSSLGGESITRKHFMELLSQCNFDIPRDYIFN